MNQPTVRRSVLRSGLRVVTEYVPGVRSASVGAWVGVGSRDEQPPVAGAAHFLEHLLFKATPTRSAREIAESIDAVGGELNAFTAKEHTCFYAHVMDTDLALGVDLVADVAMRGTCAAADVEVERGVVLEEIAMRDDDPEDLLNDTFGATMFGTHPIGRPILGTEASIESLTRAQIHSFHRRRYLPHRMVLAVAGNVSHDEVVRLVEAAFPDGRGVPEPPRTGTARLRGRPGLDVVSDDTEQVHLLLGVRSAGRHDPRRWPLSVLNAAVGGGTSSRLFQRVREERGLAYSVYSGVESHADTGAFSVYAGCQPENLAEVVTMIDEILTDVASNGLTAAEVARGQGQLRGALVLGLEDSSARMSRLGRGELSHGGHLDVDETLARIEAVTVDEVATLAADLLHRPRGLAVVGPYAHASELPGSVRAAAGA